MSRLYRLGVSRYLQHDDGTDLPDELLAYAQRSRGDMPPYIPLPECSVAFRVSREGCRSLDVSWAPGTPLPEPVLNFVCENGTLPPCSSGLPEEALAEDACY